MQNSDLFPNPDVMADTADKYAAILDDRYDSWDIYRAAPFGDQAKGDWIVKLPDECLRGATITEALRVASEFIPLPKYPRRPELLSRDGFEPYKHGSAKWRLNYYGNDFYVQTKTKKAANAAADKIVAARNLDIVAWDTQYAELVEGKTPGADFRWDR